MRGVIMTSTDDVSRLVSLTIVGTTTIVISTQDALVSILLLCRIRKLYFGTYFN